MDMEKLFEKMREKERNRLDKGSISSDPRIIKFKSGNVYKFRLVWIPNPVTGREVAFINKYTHGYKDPNGGFEWVTCPTSEYLLDRRGFDDCPICKHLNRLYKEYQSTKSKNAKDLYDTFKRVMSGFALVYVISDPVSPENNGTVKIMKYGYTINKFLKWEIFGIDLDKAGKKNSGAASENSEAIGYSAFRPENGYDLTIQVSSKTTEIGTFNDYSPKFSRTPSPLPVSESKLRELAADLRFDEDFYTRTSKEDLLNFLNNRILGMAVASLPESSATVLDDGGFDDGDGLVSTPKTAEPAGQRPVQQQSKIIERQPPVSKPAPAPAQASAQAPAVKSGSLDLDEIDGFLSEISAEYKK